MYPLMSCVKNRPTSIRPMAENHHYERAFLFLITSSSGPRLSGSNVASSGFEPTVTVYGRDY
jgi:hypothetical protein